MKKSNNIFPILFLIFCRDYSSKLSSKLGIMADDKIRQRLLVLSGILVVTLLLSGLKINSWLKEISIEQGLLSVRKKLEKNLNDVAVTLTNTDLLNTDFWSELSVEKNKGANDSIAYTISIDSLIFEKYDETIHQLPLSKYLLAKDESNTLFVIDAEILVNPNAQIQELVKQKKINHQENFHYPILKKGLRRLLQNSPIKNSIYSLPLMTTDSVKSFDYNIVVDNQPFMPRLSMIKLLKKGNAYFLIQSTYKNEGFEEEFIPLRYFAPSNSMLYFIIIGIAFFAFLGVAIYIIFGITNISDKLKSDKKQLEKTLNTQNQLFTALNNTPNAIVIADKIGKILHTNNTFKEWNGGEKIEGKTIQEITKLPKSLFEEKWSELMTKGKTDYFSELGNSKKVNTQMIFDRENETIVSVDVDVTSLMENYDDLTHSLKNYLKWIPEVINIELAKMSDERAFELLKIISESVTQVILLAKNLQSDLNLNETPENVYHLSEEVDLVIQNYLRLEEGKPVQIINQAPTDYSILIKKSGLHLIFENLFFNAAAACHENETCIIKIQATEIEDANYFIEVSDNGKCLENYSTFEEMIQRSGGFGLKCIKRRIEEAGGYCIGFQQSENQQFKSFQFTLPKYKKS